MRSIIATFAPPTQVLLLGLLGPAVISAQTSAATRFEVASIKTLTPEHVTWSGSRYDHEFVTYCLTMKSYIQMAYHMRDYGVLGPDWLSTEWYEIIAKLPEGHPRPTPEMLQLLLVERFNLASHTAQAQRPVYFLMQDKGGARLRPTAEDSTVRGVIRKTAAGYHMEATARTLEVLATALSAFVDRPVIDNTGIKGRYDFSLDFSPEEGQRRVMTAKLNGMAAVENPVKATSGAEGVPAASIFQSVRAYGLKLQPEKARVDVLVVDHINRVPIEN